MTSLRFGHGSVDVDVPGGAVLLASPASDAAPLDASAIAARLADAGLVDAFGGARRIALVVNDRTRQGGMRATLEAIAGLLDRARVTAGQVDMVVSYGLHARQGDDVSRAIYGDSVLARARLVHHDGRAPAGLASIGRLPDGGALAVAREVADADVRVLVGAIAFHYYAGFSGGRKAIFPGVADEASIVRNHLRVLDPSGPGGRAAGCGPARLDGNPVSEEMFAAVDLLDGRGGTTFLANARVDAAGAVVDVACGADHVAAFRAGCARHVASNALPLDRIPPFDGVIASAGGWPYDASLYQAHKAYDNAFRALSPAIARGERPPLVFLAQCDEGLGHPRFAAWLEHATRDEHYAALRARYEIVGQTSLAVRDKAALTRTVAVTEIDEGTCERLGWERAASLEDALARANGSRRSGVGPGVRGGVRWGVMPAAAQVLPLPFHVQGAGRATTPGVGT